MQRSADSADGRIYTFTQFAAAHARQVVANFEQPDLKATFAFHVTVPRHWIVVPNQAASEPEPAGDGAAVWHFEPTPRISTYMTAIEDGEYHVVRQSHTTPAASSELLDRIAEFLAGPDIDPALARVVIESRDEAEKALRSRAAS